jgi:hypothetical protein
MGYFDIQIHDLQEDIKRKRKILEMATSNRLHAWAVPFLREQLDVSEELLASAIRSKRTVS